MKIERLMYILVSLLSKKYIKANEIADIFQVSVRTIYRDIDTLSLAGIPIYSKKGNAGGFYIDEDYQLNSFLFSDVEKKAVYEMSQSLTSSFHHPKLEELNQKMAYLVEKNKSQSPYFFDLSLWKSKHTSLTEIEKAIEESRVIGFDYVSYSGEVTTREVEPINIVCKSQAWYVYGFCRLRQEMRLFRLSRIRKTCLSGERFSPEKFKPIEKEDINQFYEGISNSVKMIFVSLEFDLEVRARVYDMFSEEEIKEVDNKLIVEKEMPMENWFIEVLLGFGGTLKVIKPLGLRQKIIQQAQSILEQYDIL
ncbi:helix-turn-helix transcriptional regulator [Vagococcus carniphilus]|uniref:helix-turn-helix transcriptional regulator n=1 Tax=Vagococcus carniphilus TaxID=218144 RepID=UPI003B5A5E20